jgi:DNA-binding winged helix-turn-helix (wHTH) protein
MKKLKLVNKDKNIIFDLSTGFFRFMRADGTVQTYRIGSKECAILEFLSNNIEEVVSKDEILQNVWKERFVCENVVSVALSNIRRMLKRIDEDCLCLTTISGKGYVFNPQKSGLHFDCTE